MLKRIEQLEKRVEELEKQSADEVDDRPATVKLLQHLKDNKRKQKIRNISDEEKISYIMIGIAIGIAIGFVIKAWLDTSELIKNIGVHI